MHYVMKVSQMGRSYSRDNHTSHQINVVDPSGLGVPLAGLHYSSFVSCSGEGEGERLIISCVSFLWMRIVGLFLMRGPLLMFESGAGFLVAGASGPLL